jgi:hypothetical protein
VLIVVYRSRRKRLLPSRKLFKSTRVFAESKEHALIKTRALIINLQTFVWDGLNGSEINERLVQKSALTRRLNRLGGRRRANTTLDSCDRARFSCDERSFRQPSGGNRTICRCFGWWDILCFGYHGRVAGCAELCKRSD